MFIGLDPEKRPLVACRSRRLGSAQKACIHCRADATCQPVGSNSQCELHRQTYIPAKPENLTRAKGHEVDEAAAGSIFR